MCFPHSIEPGTQSVCVEDELGGPLPVDLDDGDLLQHLAQQPLVALDVDLDQVEAAFLAVQGDDLRDRLLAEVAALPRVDRYQGQAAALVGNAS
jgi:hypothetical protein